MTNKGSAGKTAVKASKTIAEAGSATSKLDTLVALLRQPTGATIQELAIATHWQTHSVRGALAGALKKKGHSISSEVLDGVRRYRIAEVRA